MKKIIVPSGMFEAAKNSEYEPGSVEVRSILEAALRWLSENPIVPTIEQTGSLIDWYNHKKFGNGAVSDCAVEWQRRMFLAPEPEVPEELKDLLLDENIPTADYSRPNRDYYNTQILEAFRRGQKSK